MSKADTRMVNGTYEFFDENNRQISVRGELIALTYEDGKALTQALCDETDYLDRYENTDENLDILIRVAKKLSRYQVLPDALTKSRLLAAYAVADAAGGACGDCGTLEKLREEAPAALPRTNDGRFATEHDLLRQEVRRLLSDPTVSAQSIRQRADHDRAFGDAFRAELAPVPATQPALSHEEQAQEDVTGELDSFVQSWKRIANPRFVGGYLQLDEHTRLTPIELDQWLNRATAAGLI